MTLHVLLHSCLIIGLYPALMTDSNIMYHKQCHLLCPYTLSFLTTVWFLLSVFLFTLQVQRMPLMCHPTWYSMPLLRPMPCTGHHIWQTSTSWNVKVSMIGEATHWTIVQLDLLIKAPLYSHWNLNNRNLILFL